MLRRRQLSATMPAPPMPERKRPAGGRIWHQPFGHEGVFRALADRIQVLASHDPLTSPSARPAGSVVTIQQNALSPPGQCSYGWVIVGRSEERRVGERG